MNQKARNFQKSFSPGFLLIVIMLSTLLSACGVINQDQTREDTEGFIQEEWAQENPKQTFSEWWEETKSEQNENIKAGYDKFLNWLPDSIARLFGWEPEEMDDELPLPENLANSDVTLSAFEDKVPEEVIHYFAEEENFPLDEIRLRLAIIARAETYPRNNTYDPTRFDEFGYRTDSGGFVSYVWQLDQSADTTGMIAYSIKIPLEDLKPGDALSNLRITPVGHIVLFSHWVDFEGRTFEGYHMNTTANGVSFDILDLTLVSDEDGSWLIQGIDAKGPFYPYRWKGLTATD